MGPFLDRLATALLDRHRGALDRVAVVLPGRRAGLHLRKYLAARAGGPVWSPELLDMGAFMERVSGMRQGEGMELLFLLHEAHRAMKGATADDLGEFLQWAPATLRDMSEVDAHLLDLDGLYRDLKDFHEIEEWSFRLERTSPGQERLNQQWRTTGDLHRAMARLMAERGFGTSGALARRAAEMAAHDGLDVPWDSVWFAGLNALEPAALAVAAHLQAKGRACVAWDADRSYLDDDRQEAGRFLRRSIARLGPGVLEPGSTVLELPRAFRSVSVPNTIAQANWAAEHLAGLSAGEREATAVVLADQDLLLPLLEALPAGIGPLNVTMGMPLNALPVHGLSEAFLDLHANYRPGSGYPLGIVERLLWHPFLHQGRATAAVVAALREKRGSRVEPDAILLAAVESGMATPGTMKDAIEPLDGDPGGITFRFQALLAWAMTTSGGDALAREQLFRTAMLQRRMDEGLARGGVGVPDLRTYAELRGRLMREERVAFFGEPLSGLQVMGFLETRAIDHERVLLLGANEGVLPPASAQGSWIPHEVRRAYGMPLRADTEAIAAYHFHRLAHQARELVLVHAPSSDAGGAGEPTRYIAQWKHDLAGRSATTTSSGSVIAGTPVRRAPRIAVAKDAQIAARIAEMAARGFSPSALATWLRCPLDFHFTHVLRVRSTEEVDGKLGSDVLGEAVHGVLEDVFRPFLGRTVDPAVLREEAGRANDHLALRLGRHFPVHTLAQGHFRLRAEMASHALSGYLLAEAERCTATAVVPLAIEEEVSAMLPDGTRLRGRCDRVEERGGVVHVLDMKTGGVQDRDLKLRGLEREDIVPDRRHALQLLVYAWTYMTSNPGVAMARAGIVPLRHASRSEGMLLTVEGSPDIRRDMLPAIAGLLSGLIAELRDPVVPFQHDPESTYCTCCVAAE